MHWHQHSFFMAADASSCCMIGCRGVEVGAECSEATVALIEACLSQHIAARPTARQLVTALEAMQDSADAAQPSSPAAAEAA